MRTKHVSYRVGQRIAALRRAAGLSQRDLAARLGWSRETLVNYEHGRRAIDVDRLVMMAHALEQHPATLLLDADDARLPLLVRLEHAPDLVPQVAFFLDTLAATSVEDLAMPPSGRRAPEV